MYSIIQILAHVILGHFISFYFLRDIHGIIERKDYLAQLYIFWELSFRYGSYGTGNPTEKIFR